MTDKANHIPSNNAMEESPVEKPIEEFNSKIDNTEAESKTTRDVNSEAAETTYSTSETISVVNSEQNKKDNVCFLNNNFKLFQLFHRHKYINFVTNTRETEKMGYLTV